MTRRFGEGDTVAVRKARRPGHVRVPTYVRGHAGVVAKVVGEFPNPEELAYGFDGLPARTLYRVRFRQRELWPGYDGRDQDTLDIELYEHWLVPADRSQRPGNEQ